MQLKSTILPSFFAAITTAQRLGGLLPLMPAPSPMPSSSATPQLRPSRPLLSACPHLPLPIPLRPPHPPSNPMTTTASTKNRGCDWTKSGYGYGSDYCGYSSFKPGQTLSDGNVIVAVAPNGTSEACTKYVNHACCKALDESPCRRGEKHLECYKDGN